MFPGILRGQAILEAASGSKHKEENSLKIFPILSYTGDTRRNIKMSF